MKKVLLLIVTSLFLLTMFLSSCRTNRITREPPCPAYAYSGTHNANIQK